MVRTAVLHPVIVPILVGYAWAQTGWALPAPISAGVTLSTIATGATIGPLLGLLGP